MTSCTQSDQLLTDPDLFGPQGVVDAGMTTLSSAQMLRLRAAERRYEQTLRSRGQIDPGPFFDVVGDLCEISYRERWSLTLD